MANKQQNNGEENANKSLRKDMIDGLAQGSQ